MREITCWGMASIAVAVIVGIMAGMSGARVALPACADESSTNCLWDSSTRGNGEGVSFVDVDGRTFVEVAR